MKLLLALHLTLLVVTLASAAPIDEVAEIPDAPSKELGSEESITLDPSAAEAPVEAPAEAPAEEIQEVAKENDSDLIETDPSSSLDIVTSTSKPEEDKPKSDKASLDLENIHLSPKLSTLYQRLAGLDPDVLRTGVIKFRQILIESKSRDDFLQKLWKDKNGDDEVDDPTELETFKSDLNELAEFIRDKHPKILSWFLSTVGGGRLSTTSEKLTFLEKFSEIDEEMSQFPVWNRYWTYWFQSAGDYISKYG